MFWQALLCEVADIVLKKWESKQKLWQIYIVGRKVHKLKSSHQICWVLFAVDNEFKKTEKPTQAILERVNKIYVKHAKQNL